MSEEAKTPSPRRLIALGAIVGTHGVRGLLRLFPYDCASAVLTAGLTVHLAPSSPDPRGPRPEPVAMLLRCARPHGRVILVGFDGISTIETATPLVGLLLSVTEEDLPAPAPNEYYVYQLEGLEVLTVTGERLGRVASLIPTGSNEVLVVRDGGREHLIPVIADVVRAVDLEAGRVVIEPIAGLLE